MWQKIIIHNTTTQSEILYKCIEFMYIYNYIYIYIEHPNKKFENFQTFQNMQTAVF